MYTRCKDCHTVHLVNARLLAQGAGRYRCGKCKKLCNALDALFDEWPAAGERPTASGEIPELGMPIDLAEAKQSRQTPDAAGLTGGSEEGTEETSGATAGRGKIALRITWIAMALALIAVVAFKLSEFYGKPLLEQPIVESAKIRLGLQDPPAAKPYRDLDQIHLVSRELKSHPFRADRLRLTATIVNRAQRVQPYPDLEVILLDASGEPISQVRFTPVDYLTEEASDDSGMTPQAYLPLTLDLPDPGSEAVGFELNFH